MSSAYKYININILIDADWSEFPYFAKILAETDATCSPVGQGHKKRCGVYDYPKLYRIDANDIEV